MSCDAELAIITQLRQALDEFDKGAYPKIIYVANLPLTYIARNIDGVERILPIGAVEDIINITPSPQCTQYGSEMADLQSQLAARVGKYQLPVEGLLSADAGKIFLIGALVVVAWTLIGVRR